MKSCIDCQYYWVFYWMAPCSGGVLHQCFIPIGCLSVDGEWEL